MFTEAQKIEMLKLARMAINEYLKTGKPPRPAAKDVAPYLKKPGAVFVTITLDGKLKGCIGHLVPIMPLYRSIIDNAVNAAFKDPRFMPLMPGEKERIRIEISVIGASERLDYIDADDLLSKLQPPRDGVTISKGFHKATYLPQVWEELTDKEGFMCSLCIKAGLEPYAWKNDKLVVETYRVEKFEEKQDIDK
jgi:AmmeMemoRadiSam system protein A